MKNLKGAKICLGTYDSKPNYSELGRIYGIDRRTVKKRYIIHRCKFGIHLG